MVRLFVMKSCFDLFLCVCAEIRDPSVKEIVPTVKLLFAACENLSLLEKLMSIMELRWMTWVGGWTTSMVIPSAEWSFSLSARDLST